MGNWEIRECSREMEPESDTPPGGLQPAARRWPQQWPVYELRSGGWKGEHRERAVLDNS